MIVLNAKTTREFLRAILPTEPHFPERTWYFRGQADGKWPLIASIRRKKSWDPFGGADRFGLQHDGTVITSDEATVEAQEREILSILGSIIDRMGLPPDLKSDDRIVALAQHI